MLLLEVTEQVMKTMEVLSSARPLLTFDLLSLRGVSHPTSMPTLLDWDRCLPDHSGPIGPSGNSRPAGRLYDCIHTVHYPLSAYYLGIQEGLHELVDKGQIDHFLKRNPLSIRKDLNRAHEEPREEECSTKIVATIVEGYMEGFSHAMWKAQMRGTQQVMITWCGSLITIPTIIFDDREGHVFNSLHNDPMVIELKVANSLAHRILIDTGSLADIITLDYLKKLKYPGRNITPLVHPILSFSG
ncbi:hypothetical protein Cgig2_003014 [Carnegiea gigantea]|uniref:Uncharacterized protein n=1 Tax=Carnegiea gigantea TaxID=171969 RepID=A0A9Q1GTC2_9CARY|nr:hypothetical protein Cgig2_003014 [Carnegiea gigantea]